MNEVRFVVTVIRCDECAYYCVKSSFVFNVDALQKSKLFKIGKNNEPRAESLEKLEEKKKRKKMKADPKGECSVSIRKTLEFTLPKNKFTNRENCFSKALFLPPSYIIAGSKQGTLYRWQIPEKITDTVIKPQYEVTRHKGVISVIYWCPALQYLFTAAADRKVLVWNLNMKTIPQEPLVQELNIFNETPIQILSYQKFVFVVELHRVSILLQQRVKSQNMNEYYMFTRVHSIETKSTFFSACVSSNSRVDNSGYLFVGLENGSVVQYEVQLSDKPSVKVANKPKNLADHAICMLIFNPTVDSLLAFSYNHVVRVYNTRNNLITSKIVNPNQANYVSSYCDAHGTLVMLDTKGSLYIYEADENVELLLSEKFGFGGLQITPMSENSFLYLVRDSISLYQINRGTVEKSYQLHSKSIIYVRTTKDQTTKILATVGVDRMVRFWDPLDFSMRREYKIPTHLAILSACIDIREKLNQGMLWAVTGHDNGQIIYMNLTDERKFVELPSRHKNSISSLSVVSKEMKTIMFSCDYDGFIAMWQLDAIFESMSYAAVSQLKMWKGHNKEILASAASWASGELVLATGGNDNVIKIWKEGENSSIPAFELEGHTDSITSLVFDGFFLISGSEDLTIRIWDIENRVQLFILNGLHNAAIRQVIPIPDESKFASCDASGVIYIYDYVKKQTVWEMHHSTDCKSIYLDKGLETLYACVKRELIPHKLSCLQKPTGLPSLHPTKSVVHL